MMKLTKLEKEQLIILKKHDSWVGSGINPRVCSSLCKKGLAKRRERNISICGGYGSYILKEYIITCYGKNEDV